MTRKYTTAFTLMGTLSRVITSCTGTSRVTTRRSTRRNPVHHRGSPG